MDTGIGALIFLIHQRECIGIGPDHRPRRAMLRGEGLKLGAPKTDTIIHDFRLAAIEQQRVEPPALDRQKQLGQRLAGAKPRGTVHRVAILKRDRQPEIGRAIGKHIEIGGRFGNRSKGLANEDIRNRRQMPAELLHHAARALNFEVLGKIAPKHGRDAGRHMNLMRHGVGRVSRQLGRQFEQRRPLLFIPVLSDMEGNDGIGVRGDHIRAGLDEFIMDVAHHLRRFDQRQRRPFGLFERCPIGFQLSPQPAIQNDHKPVPFDEMQPSEHRRLTPV